jgi:hypothetical protein
MPALRHSIISEATDAGFLGGTAVAIWFLLRDFLSGHPLATPSMLGQVLLFGEENPTPSAPEFGAVVAYSAVHFIAFVLFAALVAWLVRLADDNGVFRFALLVLFVVFELFFYVLINVVSSQLGSFFPAFWVLSANLVAALVMGAYFWRKHPEIKRELDREPLGA